MTLPRVLLLLLVGSAALRAQADFQPPEDLMPFWREYSAAKAVDDLERMDKTVRRYEALAIDTLDIMLDDLSVRDDYDLHGEARTLAWSLDRVKGQEQFIERVRLVLDLEMADRRQRRAGMMLYIDGIEARRRANETRSDEDFDEALSLLDQAIANFEAVDDHESAINALYEAAMVERERGRPWESSRYLARIAEHGEQLAYTEPLVDTAERLLSRLEAQGIDPEGERPEEDGMIDFGEVPDRNAGGGPEAGGPPPAGLSSFAEGSEEQTFELEPEEHDRVPSVSLPMLYPYEQYIVWPVAWVEGMGPSEFDIARNWRYQPFGEKLHLVRSSLASFGIDSDGDGEADVEFTPSTNPSLIEIPDPGGGPPMPLLVATVSDREMQFGVEVNYSPQESGARLRFGPGQHVEGRVLREKIEIHDANVSGRYGDWFENWDDQITKWTQDDHVYWVEPDAVVVGRSKRGVPWSSVLAIDDVFYRTELSPDGLHLTVRELDLPTGEVELDMEVKARDYHVVVRETGALEGAFFDVVPERRGRPVTLPAGIYQIVSGVITEGNKTSMDVIRIYQGSSEPFEVRAGETTTLELGAPYTMRIDTHQDGEEFVVDGRSLRVFGRGGEEYAMFYQDPPLPEIEVRDAEGDDVARPIDTRRPDQSHWQKDAKGNVLWFPLDVRIENPDGEALEVRLHQKSHDSLGGPLTSDWMR